MQDASLLQTKGRDYRSYSADNRLCLCGSAPKTPEQIGLDKALGGTPAIAIVLDGRSGISSPPTTAKRPEQLQLRRVYPEATCASHCTSAARYHSPDPYLLPPRLRIDDRNLPCTHPQSNITFTAEDALAYSCNTYFADLANRIPPKSL